MLKKLLLCVVVTLAPRTNALDGDILIHDPSTVTAYAGRYYTFGTGNGLPILTSDDGWTWRRTGSLMSALPDGKPGAEVLARGGNNTWAPDVIHIGDKFFLYYSAPGTQPKSAIGLLVGKSLDPASPDYHWEDGGPIVWSDGIEDSNAIDPGVLLAPDGRLWLTYGSYFGYIRLVELDPENRKAPLPGSRAGEHRNQLRSLDSYLSRRVVLPARYARLLLPRRQFHLQHPHGPLAQGDRPLSRQHGHRHARRRRQIVCRLARTSHRAGSLRPSRSRLRACRNFRCTTRRISIAAASVCSTSGRCCGATAGRSPATISWRAPTRSNPRAQAPCSSLQVQGFPVGGFRPRRPGGSGPPPEPQAAPSVADQEPAQVSAQWPATTDVRLAPAMLQAQQKWTIAPVANAGGYPGSPFFKIMVAGTERSLTANSDGELTAVPFNGAPEQLWRIDQLTDGSYRIAPKSIAGAAAALVLSAAGSSMATLAKFDPTSDRQRWLLESP